MAGWLMGTSVSVASSSCSTCKPAKDRTMLLAICGAKYCSRGPEMLFEGLMGHSPGLLLYPPLQRHTRFQ